MVNRNEPRMEKKGLYTIIIGALLIIIAACIVLFGQTEILALLLLGFGIGMCYAGTNRYKLERRAFKKERERYQFHRELLKRKFKK